MQPRKLGDFLFVSTLLVSSTLAAILLMPIVYGTFSVYGFLSGDDPIPQTGGFGLALVSAALAAVVLWFGGQSVSRGKTDTNTEHGVSRFRRLAPMSIGLALFLAAVCFTLFELLIPFLTATQGGARFFPSDAVGNVSDAIVRYTALSAFIGGNALLMIGITHIGVWIVAHSLQGIVNKGAARRD